MMQDWHWWAGAIGTLLVMVAGLVVWAGTHLVSITRILTRLQVSAEQSMTHGTTLADHETRITVLEHADRSGGWPAHRRNHDAE